MADNYVLGLDFVIDSTWVAGLDFSISFADFPDIQSYLLPGSVSAAGSLLQSDSVNPIESNLNSGQLTAIGGSSIVSAAANIRGYLVPFLPNTPTVPIASVEYMADELKYIVDYWPGHWSIAPNAVTGSLTINQPIPQFPLTLNGWVTDTYLQDFYFRIHIEPNPLLLGLILSTTIKTVEVWNSSLTSKTLNSITTLFAEGLSLSGYTMPLVYTPLLAKTYSIEASITGPPVINASYIFNFVDISLVLSVLGQRITIIGTMPLAKQNITREFLTDVIFSKNTETRSIVRKIPRESQTVTYPIKNAESYSKLKAKFQKIGSYALGVPTWETFSFLDFVAAGGITLSLPTANKEFRVGDFIILWQNENKYEALQIESIDATTLYFNSVISDNYRPCYVAPILIAKALNGFEFARKAPDKVKLKVTYTIVKPYFEQTWTAPTMFLNLPVLEGKHVILGSFTDKFNRKTTEVDFGIGELTNYPSENTTKLEQQLTFLATTKTEKHLVKRKIDWLQGRYKEFYMDSGINDLITLQGNLNIGAFSVTVKAAGWSIYGFKHIKIVGDTIQYKEVSTVTAGSAPNTEIINFVSSLTVAISNITGIQAMRKYRINSDRIELSHDGRNLMTVSTPIREVN